MRLYVLVDNSVPNCTRYWAAPGMGGVYDERIAHRYTEEEASALCRAYPWLEMLEVRHAPS